MRNVQRTHRPILETFDGASVMRAVVHDRYGSSEVLEVRSLDIPSPGAGEVLVEVAAAAVNPLDWHFVVGRPYFLRLMSGIRRPRQATRGADVAGRVVALGDGVTEFAIGDRVAGVARGSFAEYALAKASTVARTPELLGDHEAAAIPLAGVTALQALRDQAQVSAGQRVLVIGAAGGVGVHAVQVAASMGARVTGVCSGTNVDLVSALGATEVIDYQTTDWADDTRYDVIIDCVGTTPLEVCRRALVEAGTYVMIGGPTSNPWLDPIGRLIAGKVRFRFHSQRFRQFTAVMNADDVRALWDLVETGRLRSVVSKRIGLGDVPAAIGAMATGHARGKVVVDVSAGRIPGATK